MSNVVTVSCPQCGRRFEALVLVSSVSVGLDELTVEFAPSPVQHACPADEWPDRPLKIPRGSGGRG